MVQQYEQIPAAQFDTNPPAEEDAEEISDRLEDAAKQWGFGVPQPGSVAERRLYVTCKEYGDQIAYMLSSPRLKVDERLLEISDTKRRAIHDQLCRLLLRKKYSDLDYDERRRVSNFATFVAGRDEYISTFSN